MGNKIIQFRCELCDFTQFAGRDIDAIFAVIEWMLKLAGRTRVGLWEFIWAHNLEGCGWEYNRFEIMNKRLVLHGVQACLDRIEIYADMDFRCVSYLKVYLNEEIPCDAHEVTTYLIDQGLSVTDYLSHMDDLGFFPIYKASAYKASITLNLSENSTNVESIGLEWGNPESCVGCLDTAFIK